MSPIEVIITDSKKVACDGHSATSKHPLIYLNMGAKNNIACPYCSKSFALKKPTEYPHNNAQCNS